jgi:peptide/nickel transport system substrate-binding protein
VVGLPSVYDEFMKRFMVVAVVVVASVACVPTPTAERPMVIGVLSDIQSWNPYLTETQFSEDILAMVFPTLVTEQTDYQDHPPTFAPALAERWERSEDGLSLTFHLRPEARWSDGVAVTAEDVVFTWRMQIDPEVGWYAAYTKDTIATVEVVDEHTVRFTFTRDDPYQLMDVNDPILPSHRWSGIAPENWRDTDWLPHVVAAGPFRPVRHLPQQEIVLEKNPSYWQPELPKSDRIVWRIVPDQLALLTQLRAGELDFINRVPPDAVAGVEEDSDLRVVSFPDRAYTHICWNLQRPLFADPTVRRALAHAIDRQALIDGVYRGQAAPSVGPVLSTMWAFNQSVAPPSHNPAEARRLLDAAGWTDSDGDGIRDRNGEAFRFDLVTNAESTIRRDVAVLVAQQLAAVGVEAIPRSVEWGTHLSRLDSGDFDAAINRWVEPTRIDLEDVWHTPPEGIPTSNYGAYSNPEVDRLIAEVAATTVLEDQRPALDRIQEIIVADQPYAFLVESRKVVAMSSRMRDATPNDATPYFGIERWWLAPVD